MNYFLVSRIFSAFKKILLRAAADAKHVHTYECVSVCTHLYKCIPIFVVVFIYTQAIPRQPLIVVATAARTTWPT